MGNLIERVMIVILIALIAAMVGSSVARGDTWDVNTTTLNDRIGIISNVMGEHTIELIDDIWCYQDGRTLDAYEVTIIELTWQRNGYEVVTSVTVPISSKIIRSNLKVYTAILFSVAYNASSSFTMRKLPKEESVAKSVWTRSIGTWQ